MQEFFAYFHIEETNGVHRTLGHIHDSFVSHLPHDIKVYVGWEIEKQKTIRYRTKIESPFQDNDRIMLAFRSIVTTFEEYLRLGILLSKPRKGKFVLLDLIDPSASLD